MLNITKDTSGSALVVHLTGTIEESVNFEKEIGPTPREMIVNCKGVLRINSIGVKSWIKYFQTCQTNGTQIKFQECSVAIVEQFNMISNFSAGATIESIHVPFICGECQSELVGSFKTSDLKQISFNLPTLKCSKCGGSASFDDTPEEYFSFLMRK